MHSRRELEPVGIVTKEIRRSSHRGSEIYNPSLLLAQGLLVVSLGLLVACGSATPTPVGVRSPEGLTPPTPTSALKTVEGGQSLAVATPKPAEAPKGPALAIPSTVKPGEVRPAGTPTSTPAADIPFISEQELSAVNAEIPKLRERVYLSGYSPEYDIALRNRQDKWGLENKPFAIDLPSSKRIVGSELERKAKELFGNNATRVITGIQEGDTLSFNPTTRRVIIPRNGNVSASDLLKVIAAASDPDSAVGAAPFSVLALAQKGKAKMESALLTREEGFSFLKSGPGSDEAKEALGRLVLEQAGKFKLTVVSRSAYFSDIRYDSSIWDSNFERGAPGMKELIELAEKEGKFSIHEVKDPQEALNKIQWTPEGRRKVGEWFLDKLRKDTELQEKLPAAVRTKETRGIVMKTDFQRAYNKTMDEVLDAIYAEVFRSALQSSSVRAIPGIDEGLQEVLGAWSGKVAGAPIVVPTPTRLIVTLPTPSPKPGFILPAPQGKPTSKPTY